MFQHHSSKGVTKREQLAGFNDVSLPMDNHSILQMETQSNSEVPRRKRGRPRKVKPAPQASQTSDSAKVCASLDINTFHTAETQSADNTVADEVRKTQPRRSGIETRHVDEAEWSRSLHGGESKVPVQETCDPININSSLTPSTPVVGVNVVNAEAVHGNAQASSIFDVSLSYWLGNGRQDPSAD